MSINCLLPTLVDVFCCFLEQCLAAFTKAGRQVISTPILCNDPGPSAHLPELWYCKPRGVYVCHVIQDGLLSPSHHRPAPRIHHGSKACCQQVDAKSAFLMSQPRQASQQIQVKEQGIEQEDDEEEKEQERKRPQGLVA